MTKIAEVQSGTDFEVVVRFRESEAEDADPVPLTGYTLDFLEVTAPLQERITAEFLGDAAAGDVLCRVDQSDPLARGTYAFRLRATPASGFGRLTSELLKVEIA